MELKPSSASETPMSSSASVPVAMTSAAPRPRAGLVLVVMCAGMFLVLLDVTVVNVAVPAITAGLRTSTAGVQWVVDGYTVTLASLLLAGGAAGAGGLYWLSRLTEHATFASGLLGPSLVTGAGLGLLFVPLPLVALARVDEADSGVAASLLNVGRQVGGSIGLAVLGTAAWTVVANSARAHAAAAGAAGAAARQAVYQQALASGFDRAFLVAAGIALLSLVVAILTIRVRRADLSGH
ncbi:MAG: hypothetical protein ACRDOA_00005 [Streptosporangiaceae bacterium]